MAKRKAPTTKLKAMVASSSASRWKSQRQRLDADQRSAIILGSTQDISLSLDKANIEVNVAVDSLEAKPASQDQYLMPYDLPTDHNNWDEGDLNRQYIARTGVRHADKKQRQEDFWRIQRGNVVKGIRKLNCIQPGLICACGDPATTLCETCGRCFLYCVNCILKLHQFLIGHVIMQQHDTEGLKHFSVSNKVPVLQPHQTCNQSNKSSIRLISQTVTFKVELELCKCEEETEQILSLGYFPCAGKHSLNAIALDLLVFYRELNLSSQVAMRGFCVAVYNVCKGLSSIDGGLTFDYFYELFRITYREYRTAMYQIETMTDLMQALPHFETQVDSINHGCIACPRKNEEGSHHLSIDACFKLHRLKAVGKVDPREKNIKGNILSQETVREYLKKQDANHPVAARPSKNSEDNDSPCNDFVAVRHIGSNNSKLLKFDETGMFAINCGRHDMPNLLLDLFHGERRAYADLGLKR